MDYEKVFEAFTFGKLQECKNIKSVMDQHGISWEEFIDWLQVATQTRSYRNPNLPPTPKRFLIRRCPICGSYTDIHEVNHMACCQIGGKWKSQWFCSSCGWDEYSEKTITEEAKGFIKEI